MRIIHFYLAFPFGEGGTLGVTDEGREGAANAAEADWRTKAASSTPTRRLRRHPNSPHPAAGGHPPLRGGQGLTIV